MHLLLIEDDLELGAELQRALKRHGLTSVWVRSVKDGCAQIDRYTDGNFSCVILDLGLPDGKGLDLLSAWRQKAITLPIIVLTAQDSVHSKVLALDSGADDYVTKPVAIEELVSRINAITRRIGGHTSTVWSLGRLRVDMNTREVCVDDEMIALSPKEFSILEELIRLPGEIIPKHRLARALSPLDEPMELNALEVHIHNLRRKIGANVIRTVRGVGYGVEI
jgi:two-component system, OmpR family, response regulator QseB